MHRPLTIPPGLLSLILSVSGAVLALITGWRVAPTRPAPVVGLVQAVVPVIVLVWVGAPAGLDSAILALVAVWMGEPVRARVSPAEVGAPATFQLRQ